MICEKCRFWNEGKKFTDFQIEMQQEYGISHEKYRCRKIDDLVEDFGAANEGTGIETSNSFGCILYKVA